MNFGAGERRASNEKRWTEGLGPAYQVQMGSRGNYSVASLIKCGPYEAFPARIWGAVVEGGDFGSPRERTRV